MAFKPIEQVIREYYDIEKNGVVSASSEELDITSISVQAVSDINTESFDFDEFGINSLASTLSDIDSLLSNISIVPKSSETNSEFSRNQPRNSDNKKISFMNIASSLLFYFVIIGAVMLAFASTGKDSGGPRNIFGYSYFTVLSGSMQNEIPKGALVVTRKTNTADLQIGDNITFLKNSNNTTVTHQIVGIYENYDQKGARGFQTQGVNNAQPDKDAVLESNVVGKVVFSLPNVGALLAALSENLVFVLFLLGLLLILSFALQVLFKIRKEEKAERRKVAFEHNLV